MSVSIGVRGGELNPPAGAVLDTDATVLNAQWTTLPFIIEAPGTYRLTSNLTGVSGADGIVILSDNVTIDLNGFTLSGVPGSKRAITTKFGGSFSGAVIENGFVRGWDAGGVDGSFNYPTSTPFTMLRNMTVRNVTVERCGGLSIGCGKNSIVSNCIVSDGVVGIAIEMNGMVIGCTIRDCLEEGISVGNNAGVVKDCVINNTKTGIFVGSGSLVQSCSITNTVEDGITANDYSSILDCTLYTIGTVGIFPGVGSLVENCNIVGAGMHGLFLLYDTTVRGCVINGSGSDGISGSNVTGSASNSIVDNQISRNLGFGINLPTNSTGNTIYRNIFSNNVGGVMNVTGSDAPLSATSAGAGPWDNIGN